jgi:hypothetical protein
VRKNGDEAQREAFRRVVETEGQDIGAVIRLLRELERRGSTPTPKDLREIAVVCVKAAVAEDTTGLAWAMIDETNNYDISSYVREKQHPLWVLEQGLQYKVPSAILELVEQGEAEDMSWHNDMYPSFGLSNETRGEVRIWVHDNEDGDNRFEVTKADRAAVQDGQADDAHYSSDVKDAISTYRRFVSELGLRSRRALEDIDQEQRGA